MPFTRIERMMDRFTYSAHLLALVGPLTLVSAEEVHCTIEQDTYVGNAQSRFKMTSWMERGACIRSDNNLCYPTLLAVLNNIIELRKSEYGGAAGVLALLPTIGALLGAPTNEIWTLLTILPFGGGLAMALSFGGAIMPVRVEDYERALQKRNIAIGSIVSFRTPFGENDPSSLTPADKLDYLDRKIRDRILSKDCQRPGKKFIAVGLTGMILLLFGSQAAMSVVERGAVIPWWCAGQWWMHLWYFMVTLTAITENVVQLPFLKQHKLYVSSVPYEFDLSGGESILTDLQGTQSENVGLALSQLYTMPAAKVSFSGSNKFTQSRNAVLVMVSIVGSGKLASFWRLLSKSVSIAVFITGTALFASATLVALPMAVLVLTLVLSAGVFGRAIAGWLVRRVSEKEPMIHVITNSEEEANNAVARILRPKSVDEGNYGSASKKIQVEINGHVFVDGYRVATRSRWHVAILGVLANPYDLLSANTNSGNGENVSMSTDALPK